MSDRRTTYARTNFARPRATSGIWIASAAIASIAVNITSRKTTSSVSAQRSAEPVPGEKDRQVQRGEHAEPAQRVVEGELVRELGDGDDEDEIEEELEVRHASVTDLEGPEAGGEQSGLMPRSSPVVIRANDDDAQVVTRRAPIRRAP